MWPLTTGRRTKHSHLQSIFSALLTFPHPEANIVPVCCLQHAHCQPGGFSTTHAEVGTAMPTKTASVPIESTGGGGNCILRSANTPADRVVEQAATCRRGGFACGDGGFMSLWGLAAEAGGGSQQRHRRDHSSSLRNIGVPQPLRRIGARWSAVAASTFGCGVGRPTQFLHPLSIPVLLRAQ
jgi:hypothetical protein